MPAKAATEELMAAKASAAERGAGPSPFSATSAPRTSQAGRAIPGGVQRLGEPLHATLVIREGAFTLCMTGHRKHADLPSQPPASHACPGRRRATRCCRSLLPGPQGRHSRRGRYRRGSTTSSSPPVASSAPTRFAPMRSAAVELAERSLRRASKGKPLSGTSSSARAER